MATVYELADVNSENRDGEWQAEFFKELPSANVRVVNETPVTGPDGWPYLLVKLDSDSKETLKNVLAWLSSRGIGLTINAEKELPDAVLTYGMVWNYKQRGTIFTVEGETKRVSSIRDGRFEISSGQSVHAGPPSDDYLPGYVRGILRSFLKDNGIENPKVLVMSQDRQVYDLCFSVESLGHPDNSEHTSILEALSWFLPAHYSLAIVSEAGMPAFIAL